MKRRDPGARTTSDFLDEAWPRLSVFVCVCVGVDGEWGGGLWTITRPLCTEHPRLLGWAVWPAWNQKQQSQSGDVLFPLTVDFKLNKQGKNFQAS